MKKYIISISVIGVSALIILSARATPQVGVTSVTLADGTLDEIDVFAKTDVNPGKPRDYWKTMLNTKGVSHVYIVSNSVAPGGSFGWHSHPGPTLVTVKSGTATEYEGKDQTCTPHIHEAGTTFIDPGEETGHLVRNDGSVPLVVIACRIVPEGFPMRNDLPNPGYCPNLN